MATKINKDLREMLSRYDLPDIGMPDLPPEYQQFIRDLKEQYERKDISREDYLIQGRELLESDPEMLRAVRERIVYASLFTYPIFY